MIYSICSVCKFADSCDSAKTIDPFCLNYEKRPETNADHIRAMSNEELAGWTNHNCHCPPPFLDMFCPFRTDSMQTKSCQECWIDWLQSPVDGGDPK